MKIGKLWKIVGILTIFAFGFVFLGCPDVETNETKKTDDDKPGYNMAGKYTFTKTGGNCTWSFATNGKYSCSGYGITGTKTGTWSSKGNDVTISYRSSAGSTTIEGEEVFTVQEDGNKLTLTIKDSSIQLSNLLVSFGLAANSITLTKTGDVHDGNPDTPFTSIDDLAMYLSDKPVNYQYSPYTVKVNITDSDMANLILYRYVYLDLSGSTITTIPSSVFGNNEYANNRTFLTGIKIPDTVISIDSDAFNNFDNLTSVTIGNSVESIGYGAFSSCDNLTSVTIPDSVTSIGRYAFMYCDRLTSITIGNSVTSIGENAFSYCPRLTSIIIPDSVISLGKEAFECCTSLTSVTIGNGVTSIEEQTFNGCTSLASVTIGNSVTSIIGDSAFWGCTSLTAINVDADNTNYSSDQGVLYNKNKTELIAYPAGKAGTSFAIPDSVTSIGEGAFGGCTSLASITIPDGVTSIGEGAFGGCTSLTSVTIPDGVTRIGEDAFYGCTSLASITIPDGVTSIGEGAFGGCTSLTSVTIPNSVTSIGYRTFYGCTSLTSVTIPVSVTSIEGFAFSNCTSLTSVTFQGTIKSVGTTGLSAVYSPFDGDLRTKYLASSGGIGTYTTTAPVSSSSVWIKQP